MGKYDRIITSKYNAFLNKLKQCDGDQELWLLTEPDDGYIATPVVELSECIIRSDGTYPTISILNNAEEDEDKKDDECKRIVKTGQRALFAKDLVSTMEEILKKKDHIITMDPDWESYGHDYISDVTQYRYSTCVMNWVDMMIL